MPKSRATSENSATRPAGASPRRSRTTPSWTSITNAGRTTSRQSAARSPFTQSVSALRPCLVDRQLQPALAQGARRELRPGRDLEALEDPPQVRLDRLGRDAQAGRDLVIRAALDDQPDDVELAGAERHWLARSNAERQAAGGGVSDRPEQLSDRRILEHESGRAQPQCCLRVL